MKKLLFTLLFVLTTTVAFSQRTVDTGTGTPTLPPPSTTQTEGCRFVKGDETVVFTNSSYIVVFKAGVEISKWQSVKTTRQLLDQYTSEGYTLTGCK